ncbi:hypothetical protein MMC11_002840 [Xylographa trunciseda]|nr:hypothetical protein [Xylographa trunciseda]
MAQSISTAKPALCIDEIAAHLAHVEVKLETYEKNRARTEKDAATYEENAAKRHKETEQRVAKLIAKLEALGQGVHNQYDESHKAKNLPPKSGNDMVMESIAIKDSLVKKSSHDALGKPSSEGDAVSPEVEKASVEIDTISADSDQASSKAVAPTAKADRRNCVPAWLVRLFATSPEINKPAANQQTLRETDLYEKRPFQVCKSASGQLAAKAHSTTTTEIDEDRYWKMNDERTEMRKGLSKELTHDPKLPSQSPFLRLPYDIRIIIYRIVLLSARPFEKPHMLLLENFDGTILLPGDINSSVLHTCRLIYQEASPILYQNQFTFYDNFSVVMFKEERLKRISNLRLVIGREASSYDRLPGLARQAKAWCETYGGVFSYAGSGTLGARQPKSTGSHFENLKTVELDFSQWKLKKGEPFSPLLLRGIREAGWKLQKVRILGLKEHPAIEKILIGALLRNPPIGKFTTGDAGSFKPSQWVLSR